MAKPQAKGEEISQKELKIDEKDRKIVNLLNKNSRLTLKEIGQQVGLSIDGVKGRIERMKEGGAIMRFTAIPEPKFFGYPISTQVYIKLHHLKEEQLRQFIAYLKAHDRIILVMSVLGDYDIYFVLLGKSPNDLNKVKFEIREKFSDLIADWREVVGAEIHKYEEYNF